MSNTMNEIQRRRTFAIISHPDAGKTTLTEKFLLYGGAIREAGSVKSRRSQKHAVSPQYYGKTCPREKLGGIFLLYMKKVEKPLDLCNLYRNNTEKLTKQSKTFVQMCYCIFSPVPL